MAVNVDLMSQELPGHATAAITTTPQAFELRKGGKITVTSEDVAFRVWFSATGDDGSIPAAAMSFAIGDKPEYELRKMGAAQKGYCMVACDAGSGNAKLIQE